MLIQFRAENFLSIKGSVVLSLLASKDKRASEASDCEWKQTVF